MPSCPALRSYCGHMGRARRLNKRVTRPTLDTRLLLDRRTSSEIVAEFPPGSRVIGLPFYRRLNFWYPLRKDPDFDKLFSRRQHRRSYGPEQLRRRERSSLRINHVRSDFPDHSIKKPHQNSITARFTRTLIDPLLFGGSPAFFMARRRTAAHEETELLSR